MDVINMALSVLILILGVLLAILLYHLLMAGIKECASIRSGYFWIYKCRIYRMAEPDWSKSKYLNKYHDREDKYLGCYSTIDDEVMWDVAQKLLELSENMTSYEKEEFLLAFVQQNIKYTKDERYGVRDHWIFPVNTLRMHMGDCEDSSFLYASLAYLMRINVCVALVPKHCTCGVIEGKRGAMFEHKYNESLPPSKYYFVESTGFIAKVGMYNMSTEVYRSSNPVAPDAYFMNTLKDLKYIDD